MENPSPMLLLLEFPSLLALLFTILLFHFSIVRKWKSKSKKLPPGPRMLPFIGNLHQLIPRAGESSLPHHVLSGLSKKYGPIMQLKMGELAVVVISSPDITEEVLKTQELNFAQRPQLLAADIMSYQGASIVFVPYDEYWKNLRRIYVLEVLSNKRVHQLKTGREEEVWSMIESIKLSGAGGQPVNLSHMLYALTHNIISRAVLGEKFEQQEEFTTNLRDVIRLVASFKLDDIFPSLKFLHFITGKKAALERAHKKMDKILGGIVEDHKARRKVVPKMDYDKSTEEDLVDVLLRLKESGDPSYALSDNHIKAIILDIFGAGSETSATVLIWAMTELLRDPEVMAKAQAELRNALKGKDKIYEEDVKRLPYLNAVIKEALRLRFPGPLLPREARVDCQICGYDIPAKTTILINAAEMTRDPKYWVDADCFKPERFLDLSSNSHGMEYVPFGAGRRKCPGETFANSSIELALSQLLYHFDWKLPGGVKPEELDMTEVFQITTRRKTDLYAIAVPYKP